MEGGNWDFQEEDVETVQEHRDREQRFRDSCAGVRNADRLAWESPAERNLASLLVKYLSIDTDMYPGNNTRTQHGWAFRPDIVVAGSYGVMGVEVDGKDYHEDPDRDRLRDSLLLAGRFMRVIYRIPAYVALFAPHDFIFALSRYEPALFDAKAKEVLLPRLCSRKVREIEVFPQDGLSVTKELPDFHSFDGHAEVDAGGSYFPVGRFSLDVPMIARTVTWAERAWDATNPISFDAFVAKYKLAVKKATKAG